MSCSAFRLASSAFLALLLTAGISGSRAAGANRPGGGTGAGPDVTSPTTATAP